MQAWRDVREAKFHENPICENPFGLENHLRKTEEVHHIKPVAEFPLLAFTLSNLMSLCYSCHRRFSDMERGKIEE